MARILVVEDDPNISKLIAASLHMAGHRADVCREGTPVVDLVFGGEYDLVLLDIMLPGMDGFEIMSRIRIRSVPVIFLTAKGNVADRVTGLRLGADDYIVKPFEPVELLARVEAVLRRAGKATEVYSLHGIELNVTERLVRKDGHRVNLAPKEFDLLALLMQNVNIALAREKILAIVWGYSYQGETRTVDTHIQQLRKKLDLKDCLRTVSKVGYRLEKDDALWSKDFSADAGAGDVGGICHGLDDDTEQPPRANGSGDATSAAGA